MGTCTWTVAHTYMTTRQNRARGEKGRGWGEKRGRGWGEKTMEKARVRSEGQRQQMTYIGLVHIGPLLHEVANQLQPACIILHVPGSIHQWGVAVALEGPRHRHTE
jgi:hypothetical protein